MTYFKKTGKANTEETVKIALAAAEKYNIKFIVVASTKGETAKLLRNSGKEITVVTHQNGYKEAGTQEFPQELREELTAEGFRVLTTTHFLAGADRAANFKFGGIYPSELIAHSLRIMGQGYKVCVEIAVMAMDAGFVPAGEDIIAIGGSGRGADTAIILRPAHSQYFFDTDVKEILCMPRGHHNN